MSSEPRSSTGAEPHPERLGLRGLLTTTGFRRLLAVRFTAQWADGAFQAALGGAVLFNPEREADPLAVAAGLAVLLVPYSLIGPFAGALLDRWDRRRVLMAANLLRAVLVASVAVMVGAGVSGPALYLGALAVTGVSRFVLAGLSAALPHVVARRHIVEANVLAATAGAALAALGAGCAIGLRALVGADDFGSAATTAVTALGSLAAAALAIGFRRGLLGPDEPNEPREAMRAIAHGLVDGARATVAVPSAAAAFIALTAHRVAFGITTLLSLLLFRYAFTDHGPLRAGLAGIGEAVLVAAVGLGAAAVLTPWLAHRLGGRRTISIALLVAAVAQLGLASMITLPAVLIAAFVLPTAGQVVKLCTDAAVQSEVADEFRGRVFALYDAIFNVGYVVAVAVAATLSPPDGRAPVLLVAAAAVYVLGLAGYEWWLRRGPGATRHGTLSPTHPAPPPTA